MGKVAKKQRKSNWYSICVCSKCENRLTDRQIMYSSGTCPYCGHTWPGTIVGYNKVTIRSVKHYNWWQLFNRETTYEGANDYSKQWLITHTKN